MIGPEAFAAMPDDAYFINTARAALIEDGALLAALETDEIRGAALDIYPEEPIAETDPLLAMDTVVIACAARKPTALAVGGSAFAPSGQPRRHLG
ncbi:MAG: phosphoglycerate dehydrogenase related dehydrogenase [halophilic archaeon J07HX5]|nr:MAG: phosphoglycerate dehydrogenase related dehydrogenase [halophilic archaeon J07HX5]